MGRPLQWSTAEVEVRRLIAETIDRKVDLASRWADADDKTALKLSGELRLLEASIARLLKQVKTDMPVSPTQKSQKAARAANARWEHT
ncbi:hypothetical protein SAMN04488581_0404 [Mycolicibacterium neoaurum]|uniref:hypothetical protein n=1 Tax=Mycolicibacterium neoaurum TaxID=1795 RepID=UPI000690B7C2|nr:hypothetical protein [Mycolicibacterium neoaurum]SDC26025.1 hypothetical protein SAMN04488581_0404 [Mycolicibacterium neoaurum]